MSDTREQAVQPEQAVQQSPARARRGMVPLSASLGSATPPDRRRVAPG